MELWSLGDKQVLLNAKNVMVYKNYIPVYPPVIKTTAEMIFFFFFFLNLFM